MTKNPLTKNIELTEAVTSSQSNPESVSVVQVASFIMAALACTDTSNRIEHPRIDLIF